MYTVFEFQSTFPMRGGTSGYFCGWHAVHISIHPPHAGRDLDVLGVVDVGLISIHPPHILHFYYILDYLVLILILNKKKILHYIHIQIIQLYHLNIYVIYPLF